MNRGKTANTEILLYFGAEILSARVTTILFSLLVPYRPSEESLL